MFSMFSFNPMESLLVKTLSWCEAALISLAASVKQNTIGDIVSLYMGGIGFIPAIFNAIVGEFFHHHDLRLINQHLIDLDIPVTAPAARWHEDFYARLEEKELQQELSLKFN